MQGLHALEIADIVGEGHINIESILPFVTDNGQRLNFGQVDAKGTDGGEHTSQGAFCVGQRENECRLVAQLRAGGVFFVATVTKHEKAGEVVFVVLDAAVEQLESVASRGIGMANGGVPMSPHRVQCRQRHRRCRKSPPFSFSGGVPDSDGTA